MKKASICGHAFVRGEKIKLYKSIPIDRQVNIYNKSVLERKHKTYTILKRNATMR